MSWSLNTKCHTCNKLPNCGDHIIISSAIEMTHYLGSERSHLGGGCITVDCQNFIDNTTPSSNPVSNDSLTNKD